jgi:hypothetical protein
VRPWHTYTSKHLEETAVEGSAAVLTSHGCALRCIVGACRRAWCLATHCRHGQLVLALDVAHHVLDLISQLGQLGLLLRAERGEPVKCNGRSIDGTGWGRSLVPSIHAILHVVDQVAELALVASLKSNNKH